MISLGTAMSNRCVSVPQVFDLVYTLRRTAAVVGAVASCHDNTSSVFEVAATAANVCRDPRRCRASEAVRQPAADAVRLTCSADAVHVTQYSVGGGREAAAERVTGVISLCFSTVLR
jgi:hypothetical protein